MNNLPERVLQAELDLIDHLDKLKNLRGKISSIEVDKTIQIADARNEAGKPIFTNDKARDAARERLCAEDEDYQETYRELRKGEHDAKVLEATLNKLKMDFKEHLLDREEHIRRMDALFLREELRSLIEETRTSRRMPVKEPETPALAEAPDLTKVPF
jgi:hypothetical protein